MFNSRGILFAALFILIVAFSFGGLTHALLPHEHSHELGAIDLVHAAVRLQEKQDFLTPLLFSLVFVSLVVLVNSHVAQRQWNLVRLHVKASHAENISLRRGVAKYRRFR